MITVFVLVSGCTDDSPGSAPSASSPAVTSAERGNDPVGDRPVPSTLPTAVDTTEPVTTVPSLPGGGFGRSPLTFFGACPALLDHFRTEASARVTAWGFGWGGWDGPWAGADGVEETADDGDVAGGPTPSTVAPDHSTTNTQEVGVDEGDVVETDGRYVYTAVGERLRIVEVASASLVSEPVLPSGGHQMILDGSRLLVASQRWQSGEETVVSVFDVSTPAAPVLLIRTHLEGRLVATRSIDGMVRLVLSSGVTGRLPFVSPDRFGLDEDAALRRNRQIIEESVIEDWLPRMFDEAGDGTFGPMRAALDCTDVAAPSEYSGLGVSWIATVDLRGAATTEASAGIVSTGETVYASSTSLYVATVPWEWYEHSFTPGSPTVQPPTSIHAFSLDAGTGATYRASGQVPGTLIGQFAMSEFDGVLRVASTTDEWDDRRSESAVHVLRQQGDTLVRIAAVEGLGKTERIYAVRFLGPTAYVVTFRQIDPLYVIDLSDPVAPVLQGELKIPGYSAYLHPVGDGLLLGVGQDATDDGRALGTQLSLFDVSVPTDPQRISTLAIGGWSDVEWDHHAFLYWPADGTIVLPVSPGWGTCGPGVTCLADGLGRSGSGVVVARLQDRELVGVGVVSHPSGPYGCWNPLRRSVVIGDELVTVGLDRMVFSDRATLVERGQARWGTGDEFGCGYWID